MNFQAPFFQTLIFTSNRRRTSTYYKISIQDFFPRITKLPSDLKLVHWGPSYGSSGTIFFKRFFMSNRRRTSTYHKILIKDFFPRILKLPSDWKSDHWGPSYGSLKTVHILLYRTEIDIVNY